MTDDAITLYHAPHTRSSMTLALLEELGVPYRLEVVDRGKGEHRTAAYLAVNPMGQVPALRDGTEVMTETVALFIHLADRFPEAGLAPPIGDPLRARYLRWLVFYAAAFEPAITERASRGTAAEPSSSAYGDYDRVIGTVVDALAPGPYLLGERFSAADVLWGSALGWVLAFKLVPERPELVDYAARIAARPASQRATARDGELAAVQRG